MHLALLDSLLRFFTVHPQIYFGSNNLKGSELRRDLDVVVVVRPRLELAGRRHEPLRVADRIILPIGAVPHQLLHCRSQLRKSPEIVMLFGFSETDSTQIEKVSLFYAAGILAALAPVKPVGPRENSRLSHQGAQIITIATRALGPGLFAVECLHTAAALRVSSRNEKLQRQPALTRSACPGRRQSRRVR